MSEKRTITTEKEIVVTDRDIELVSMIAEGMKAKDMEEKTGTSSRTFEARIASAKRKYNAKTIASLAVLFMRNKLID